MLNVPTRTNEDAKTPLNLEFDSAVFIRNLLDA